MQASLRQQASYQYGSLQDSQPTIRTPAVQVAHLEEESTDKEECADSEDPDGIEGVTEEFIVCMPGQ